MASKCEHPARDEYRSSQYTKKPPDLVMPNQDLLVSKLDPERYESRLDIPKAPQSAQQEFPTRARTFRS